MLAKTPPKDDKLVYFKSQSKILNIVFLIAILGQAWSGITEFIGFQSMPYYRILYESIGIFALIMPLGGSLLIELAYFFLSKLLFENLFFFFLRPLLQWFKTKKQTSENKSDSTDNTQTNEKFDLGIIWIGLIVIFAIFTLYFVFKLSKEVSEKGIVFKAEEGAKVDSVSANMTVYDIAHQKCYNQYLADSTAALTNSKQKHADALKKAKEREKTAQKEKAKYSGKTQNWQRNLYKQADKSLKNAQSDLSEIDQTIKDESATDLIDAFSAFNACKASIAHLKTDAIAKADSVNTALTEKSDSKVNQEITIKSAVLYIGLAASLFYNCYLYFLYFYCGVELIHIESEEEKLRREAKEKMPNVWERLVFGFSVRANNFFTSLATNNPIIKNTGYNVEIQEDEKLKQKIAQQKAEFEKEKEETERVIAELESKKRAAEVEKQRLEKEKAANELKLLTEKATLTEQLARIQEEKLTLTGDLNKATLANQKTLFEKEKELKAEFEREKAAFKLEKDKAATELENLKQSLLRKKNEEIEKVKRETTEKLQREMQQKVDEQKRKNEELLRKVAETEQLKQQLELERQKNEELQKDLEVAQTPTEVENNVTSDYNEYFWNTQAKDVINNKDWFNNTNRNVVQGWYRRAKAANDFSLKNDKGLTNWGKYCEIKKIVATIDGVEFKEEERTLKIEVSK